MTDTFDCKEISVDVAVIGAGPAGLAAAVAAKEAGAARVLVLERDAAAGGILQQCIHPGFGLTLFKQELTGPEYAGIYIDRAKTADVVIQTNTMVLSVSANKEILCAANGEMTRVRAKSVVLAMGCRERTRGNITIPGTRPAGVFTAGTAQRLLNRQGILPGRRVVIVGSGDIGMIMARRLSLEGVKVEAVVELMDYLAGLTRNYVQCLQDFNIPLMLSHTVTQIHGTERVEGVTIAQVDEKLQPVKETGRRIDCDTVLFSVGLIPENELSRSSGVALSPVTNGPLVNQHMQTSVPGIFACGNVTHVNDLADNVSLESERAGRFAAAYAAGNAPAALQSLPTEAGGNVRYICPQSVDVCADAADATLFFRVARPVGGSAAIVVTSGGQELLRKRVKRLNPGEMEQVTISGAALAKLTQPIRIDIETEAAR